MAQDCSNTSEGFTPIPDMSAVDTYLGHLGMLYEDVGVPTNTIPAAHAAALAAATALVEKLDATGTPSPGGDIVVISTGMSNSNQKWAEFMRDVPDRNPAIILVNGAIPNRTADNWANNDSDVWATMNTRLAAKGVNRLQVQVVWLEHAIGGPTGDFATHLAALMGYYKSIVQNLASFFPNAKLLFWSPRTYGGYSTTGNPEPYAYQTGYAVRDIILEQTSGSDPDLAIGAASPVTDFASGTIVTGAGTVPAMAWATWDNAGQWEGAYWWSDGETANSQGLQSFCADYESDGLHPAGDDDGVFSPDGMEHKAAARLESFFENSPYTTPWWFPPITPAVVGTIQSTTTTDTFTSAAYTPPANEIQLVFVFSRAGATPVQPVVTGHGITYTPVDRQLYASIASPGSQVAVFEGAAVASPTNTVLTVNFPAQNQTCCIVIAVSVPIIYARIQAKKNATDSANALSVNLDPQTDEVFTIAAFGDIVGAAFTEKAGWTELSDLNTGGTPVGRLAVHYITPYDTPATGTRSGAGDMQIAGVVLTYEGPPPQYLLEVTTDPTDGGTITSSPAGISYPSDPDHEYNEGTVVNLTATPTAGYVFVEWQGDFDSAVGNVATVTMDEAKQITAVFRAIQASDFGTRPQSGRNSRHWSVWLPTGLGPFDGWAGLRCGDLESVRDNERMLPGSIYGRDLAVTGRRKELVRVSDESQAGSLSLSCTEEAAGAIDQMRKIGCPFPLQRRTCLPTMGLLGGDPTTLYEHYTAVSLGERSLDNPTAGGLDKDDDTPSVTIPGIFGRRFTLTDTGPGSFDFVDGEESTTEYLVSLTYCHNPLCGDCGLPCDTLYALVRVTIDEDVGLVIYKSEDGGANWDQLATAPFAASENQSDGLIFCYQGSRLFATAASGNLYYSDNPDDGEWYEVVQLDSLSGISRISKITSDGYTLFAIVGDANQTGIIRSVDGGIAWEYVVPIDSLTTGQFWDISIAGNVVIAYGVTGGGNGTVAVSYRNGDFQTWTTFQSASWPVQGAIAAANSNPFDAKRAWFYVFGVDGSDDIQMWKGSSADPSLMELIYEADYTAVTWEKFQIFLDGDGYIGWFHATQDDGTSITLRTSTGGDRITNVSIDTTSEEETGRAILAVCPHDPDVGFVGYTASMP